MAFDQISASAIGDGVPVPGRFTFQPIFIAPENPGLFLLKGRNCIGEVRLNSEPWTVNDWTSGMKSVTVRWATFV
ncbi:MAG: hypothetical protein P1V13_05250 [Rhizobiaceae bacterium]|nr:hypothetical protein [Rhizobiaceae bacterium]